MVNKYLFLAYAFVWVIFILYAWNLTRRQARLGAELEDLKKKVATVSFEPPGNTPAS